MNICSSCLTLGEVTDQVAITSRKLIFAVVASIALLLINAMLLGGAAQAQLNVVTEHNDIGRTGQNLNETILTPATVSAGNFGKLFSQPVSGDIWGQPLYVSQVTIPGKGVHNVIYVGSTGDYVYAFDADTNGGTDAKPLWSVSLLTNTTPAGTLQGVKGVHSSPVIDLSTNTIYLISGELVTATSTYIYRLHALDITTGAEKFGGPSTIQASVPGTGSGSSGGMLTFDAATQLQRPGLLLLNGVVYIAFGSIIDEGTWHGWLYSYNASTMAQISVFCTTPNGSGGGLWMGGSGLAAEVFSPAKPYGRLFLAIGNGSYAPTQANYSMSVVDFDLTDGKFTVEDLFTPYDEVQLEAQDADIGSGGPVLLPTQTLASGKTLNPLVEIGKSGMIYILDRDNNTDGSNTPTTEYSPAGLSGYNTAADAVVQEVQTPQSGGLFNWGAGVWGTEAYWNNNIYAGGTNPGSGNNYTGSGNSFTAYSFVNGVLSTTPTSVSTEQFFFPGPSPSISANGSTNGIVWVLKTDGFATSGPDIMLAFDATNLQNQLFSTNTNPTRDSPGGAVRFTTPTVVNGKVYVGAAGQLSVYGLLVTPTAATPVLTPGGPFSGSQKVIIIDSTGGAQIYYTTDGTVPTVSSNLYTGPITLTTTETITAIASATGYLQSAAAAATYTATTSAANPVFSLAAGSYSGTQTLTITDATSGATIYYTFDGSTPTTASSVYSGPISVPVSETIQAIAAAPGLSSSSMVSAAYLISPPYLINFTNGFSEALTSGQMQFNGSTDLDDYRLQLTNGAFHEAGSAFYTTPVNIQSFTTDFALQLSNPVGDGITFTIQNAGLSALGADDKGLGYAGISNSVAIKFDINNDAGQGYDSTGMYLEGDSPTVPSIDLTNTGINLRSGDPMDVHITYDGTILNMTITEGVTFATWSHAFKVNIPRRVGGPTAYMGFTGSTGGTAAASQKIGSWTYFSGPPAVPNYPAGIDAANLVLNGSSSMNGSALLLTNGLTSETTSAFYATPVNVDSFTTAFDFKVTRGKTSVLADGLALVLQNASPNAIGSAGGGLGYATIPNSVAIKFDSYSNAGEGTDSTGLYLDGAMPTVPSIDLTSSGLNLSGGDQIHAVVSYSGTTLTWTLTDVTAPTQPTVTNSVNVNIPDTVGGNTAYIGFTASSGDGTADQSILDWTFNTP